MSNRLVTGYAIVFCYIVQFNILFVYFGKFAQKTIKRDEKQQQKQQKNVYVHNKLAEA